MAETKIPDIVETLHAILKAGWTSGNTNSRTPQFFRRQHIKPADHATDDVVVIYDKASTTHDRGIMYKHTNYEDYASIEVRTSRGPRQAKRMQAEVERLINANHSSPTSYVEYESLTSNTASSFNYDLLEKTGINRPWVHDEGTRTVIEVKGTVYYQQHHE
jgi:hypothetical protein